MPYMYLSITYEEYRALEEQLRNFAEVEKTHGRGEPFYHKSLRLHIGDLTFEIHGPAVASS
jgi:hypothetical protein